MKIKTLGSQGLKASEIGLGCMGMSEFYGPRNDEDSLKTLDRSLELGINFWDTADVYGPHLNEILVGRALKGKRDRVTLATKFGIIRDPSDPTKRGFSGTPAYVRSACEASLKRLGIETIDLYYLHRVDPATPVEETVGAMGELVKEGKIRAIGLSEVTADTLRKAHAVHPVTAVQSEYSIWSREPEDGILDSCKELGVAFVAYSPLGRGFLTGGIKKFEDLAADDYRRFSPRFQGEKFPEEFRTGGKDRSAGRRKRMHALSAGAGLGPRAGGYYLSDTGNKTDLFSGRKCRRPGNKADGAGIIGDRSDRAEGSSGWNTLSSGNDGQRESVSIIFAPC